MNKVSDIDQTGFFWPEAAALMKLQNIQSHSDISQRFVGVASIRLSSSQAGHDYPPG
ncbi:hypothetical protein D1AOALGA4SA_10923 [Olavius algarvensis Delta 1 endosymbiont]|nr:hypothetical protein D1AOALGA4SA_10923 [Olavius algarvensis Delta 1 endosymbiont]